MTSTRYNDQAVIRQYLTRAKRMRLFSTPESTERGEVTLLALAETLAAVSVSWWIAIRYGTVTHIVIGAAIAPMLLLRTRLSTRLALYWSRHDGDDDPGDVPEGNKVFVDFFLYVLVLIPLYCLWLRVTSTVIVLLRRSQMVFREIPKNWRRYAVAIDVLHPPEALPGLELLPDDHHPMSDLRFSDILARIFKGETWPSIDWIIAIVVSTLTCVSWFLPSFLFRFSLKSTSIVYSPFIWVVQSHVGESLTGREYIHDIQTGKLERLQRWYAWLIVVMSAASLAVTALPIVAVHNLYTDGGDVLRVLLDLFIPTNGLVLTFKGWHLARLANALIVLYLFFHADRASRRIESGRWSDDQVKGRIELTRRIQMGLALYTMFCTISRLVQFAIWEKLPSVEFQFLP